MGMQFALCVPFVLGDIWVDRLERLGVSERLQVYEFTHPEEMAKLPGLLHFNAVWVVMDGAEGMEAVHLIREKHGEVPIVWVSNDAQFGLASYRLRVSSFLCSDCTDEQLEATIKRYG